MQYHCERILMISRLVGALSAALMAASCAFDVDKLAESHGLQQSWQRGTSYDHLLLWKDNASDNRQLHIYIEGDGIPWHFGRTPSPDPTPKNPVALKLMSLDEKPSVYLGRPCNFGAASDTACDSDDWTFGRYSADIVDSMAAVIASLDTLTRQRDIVIFGYSGGGALARLLAERIDGVVAIVTIAANLDTDAWTESHGYLPLSKSVNPANLPPLPDDILHLQLIGEQDKVVLPIVTQRYQEKGQPLIVWRYREFDHRCCWQDEWTTILSHLDATLGKTRMGTIYDREF